MIKLIISWINSGKDIVKKLVKRLLIRCFSSMQREIDERFKHVALIAECQNTQMTELRSQQERLEFLQKEDKTQWSEQFSLILQTLSENEKQLNDLIFRNDCLRKEMLQTTEEILKIKDSMVDNYSCIDYFDFEDHFRGSREDIKNRQKVYLPYFTGKNNVFDLGCGRGEFVELLTENQIGVTGVDQYQEFVDYCRGINLNVVLDDAIEALNKTTKLDGIFLGQVVEHIPLQQVVRILELAYEKLEEGCYIIAETPNPTSLAIFTQSFYIDPSHNKPVHPALLKYLAEKAGFQTVELLYTEGSKYPVTIPKLKIEEGEAFNDSMNVVSEVLFGSQDYALIARR